MKPVLLAVLASLASLPGCERLAAPAAFQSVDSTVAPARRTEPDARQPPGRAQPRAIVHKSPTCGCCEAWVDYLRQAGFQVEVRNADNLNPVKERLGVPYGKGSCHTAEIGGYVVEGHVPADDIKRLLRERLPARGLVLPGMPIGSPGMEVPDGTVQPYTVELVRRDGSVETFASHGP